LERLKQGKYNKPHWLRYIRGHKPPGPTEEEEEEEEARNLDSLDLKVKVIRLFETSKNTYSTPVLAYR
jgi:hypothetical protein